MTSIINNNLPIGFFDSGVGGLSVLARFKKVLPAENIIYFGDTIHLPYGNKSREELISYAGNIINFLSEKGVKAVIIACNTSSAQAYDYIKDNYNFPIYPIIQCCAKQVAESGINRVGIFATEATVKSKKYSSELLKYNPNIQVKEMASKNWVGIVERTDENLDENIKNIKNEIREMLDFHPDKIILGCTHYPYLMDEFIKYAPKEIFVDPAEIFVEYIKQDLKNKGLISDNKSDKSREQFYVSANPKEFVRNAKIFYDIDSLPELV